VDVRQDTTTGDGRSNHDVELFVTSDGELEMTRCNALDFEVLGGVTWVRAGR
jgi:hypothetical protein